jgi:hypothetical protein
VKSPTGYPVHDHLTNALTAGCSQRPYSYLPAYKPAEAGLAPPLVQIPIRFNHLADEFRPDNIVHAELDMADKPVEMR